MARCGFSKFVEDFCDKSASQKNQECILLNSCKKDIRSHLRNFNVVDSEVDSEVKLIMARAGNILFSMHLQVLSTFKMHLIFM